MGLTISAEEHEAFQKVDGPETIPLLNSGESDSPVALEFEPDSGPAMQALTPTGTGLESRQ